MTKPCFFCDVDMENDENIFISSENFYSRYDDFPITKGHCEIVYKKHLISITDIKEEHEKEFFKILKETKKKLIERFSPDGFNFGTNEDKAGGQSQAHLHLHVIPRYKGDLGEPYGGIRNIVPEKRDYSDIIPEERRKYIEE